jgi:hypothetical protein
MHRKTTTEKYELLDKYLGTKKYCVKYRVVIVQDYSRYRQRYEDTEYRLEAKFIVSPRWYLIKTCPNIKIALAEKNAYETQLENPRKKVVVTKAMEVLKIIEEETKERDE